MIIDKEVQTVHCKLTHLDITFLITDTLNYCLGINAYGYTPIIITRMSQPFINNKKSEKTVKKKSQGVLMKNRLMIKNKINYELKKSQDSRRVLEILRIRVGLIRLLKGKNYMFDEYCKV